MQTRYLRQVSNMPKKQSKRTRNLTQTVKMIPVEQLKVDHRYQRDLNTALARKIAENFQHDLFGTLHVSKRSGRHDYYVLDGQTRLEAARACEIPEVPCELVRCDSIAEEARIFRLLNTERKVVGSFALWKARLQEGDPAAKGLLGVLEARGCSFWEEGTNQRTDFPVFNAVTGLQVLYKQVGGHIIDEALSVIIEAYDPDYPHGANGATFFKGLAHFIVACQAEDKYDADTLALVLKKTTPDAVMERAAAPSLYSHSRVRMAMTVIGELYNKAQPAQHKVRLKSMTGPKPRAKTTATTTEYGAH